MPSERASAVNRIALVDWLRRAVRGTSVALQSASPIEVERAEYLFYVGYLREGMIAFDVGANIGRLTLLFSRFVGATGRVHAFEPSPSVFGRLRTICELSGEKNILLNHTAVSHIDGTVTLHQYDDDHLGWSSLARRPLHLYGIDVTPVEQLEVSSTTIDTYCRDHHISHIDLLKIDVEGAEFQVLLGAQRMLQQKRIRCCLFEFGGTTFDMGNRPSEIHAYMKSHGYKIRNVVKRDRVFPGSRDARSARFSMHVATPTSL